MKEPIQSWDLYKDQIEKIKIIKEVGLFEQCVNDIIKGTMITEITDTQLISDEVPVDDYEFFDSVNYSFQFIDEYFEKSEELMRKKV